MKLDAQHNGMKVEGNLGGEKHHMGIAEDALAHVMDTLANLYSDRVLAVIREYSTNALDAQIESGFPGAIDVTLPSTLQSFLVVRDYGTGLDNDDIRTIYSQYGASTKRGTNAQNGMLGFGCKSALSYASQFTIRSVKNGVKTIVSISRDEDGTGSMTTVSETPTDESNGTQVKIPVQPTDIEKFHATAARFFSYWKPGTVMINGKQPEQFKGLKISEDLYLIEGHKQDKLVMGNVAYPMERSRLGLDFGYSSQISVLAFVPMSYGRVFTPSREQLDYGRTSTKQALKDIRESFEKNIAGAVQREVDAAPNKVSAIRVVGEWNRKLPHSLRGDAQHKYQGVDVPRSYTIPATPIIGDDGKPITHSNGDPMMARYDIQTTRADLRHGQLSRVTKDSAHPASAWHRSIWITGFDVAKLTANHKHKLMKFHSDNGVVMDDIDNFVMLPPHAEPPREWIEPSKISKWADVNAVKLPRSAAAGATRLGGRIPGSYDAYVDGDFKHVQANDIRTNKPVIFYQGNRYEGKRYLNVLNAIHATSGYTLVMMPANRIEKFKRYFPMAKLARVHVQEQRDAWFKRLPMRTKQALVLEARGDTDQLRLLEPAKVDDPVLRNHIATAKVNLKEVHRMMTLFNRTVGAPEPISWSSPLNNYPLYDELGAPSKDQLSHVYIYINAAYAARTQEV